jgi:hypothetical protein
MMNPMTISVLTAYIGAGIFYAGADLVSARLSKQLASPYTLLALAVVAVCWGPTCLLATFRYARAVGWRAATLYFKADVIPALAIFLGGVALGGAGS